MKLGIVIALNAGDTIEEYTFVGVSSDNSVTNAAASGNYVLGAALRASAAEEVVDVQLNGVAKVRVGTGGVIAGKPVRSAANGTAIAYDATVGAVNLYAGVALTSGVAGDIIDVKLS